MTRGRTRIARSAPGQAVYDLLSDGEFHPRAEVERVWLGAGGGSAEARYAVQAKVRSGALQSDGNGHVRLVSTVICGDCGREIFGPYATCTQELHVDYRGYEQRGVRRFYRHLCPDCVDKWLQSNQIESRELFRKKATS